MTHTFGWRNYQFHDNHCGTEDGEQIFYDLENGVFNMCSIEVVTVEKVFQRVKKKTAFRTIMMDDKIVRYYIKIGYYSPNRPEKASTEIFEIREEEVESAREVCDSIRKKIQTWQDAKHAELLNR